MDEFSYGKAKLRIKTDGFEYGTEIDQFQWKFAIRILGKWGKTPREAVSKWQQRGDQKLQEAERLGQPISPESPGDYFDVFSAIEDGKIHSLRFRVQYHI
jgi:hypothetical protein